MSFHAHAPAADWPGLWLRLLQARASPRAAVEGLGWSAHEGWQPTVAPSEPARALFETYKPMLDAHRRGIGSVLAQLGVSLDGCIATGSGDSHYVSGEASLLHLHRLRALADAVLVGAGTVAFDDPRLTTRRVPGPHPVRVVLDPAARLDGRARVLRDAEAPTLWVCDARHAAAAGARQGAPGPGARPGCEVLAVAGLIGEDGRPEPRPLVDALLRRGLRLLFVEGGGVTVSRFIEAGCVDRLHLIVAPVLTGSGRRGLQLPGRLLMRDCPRPPTRRLALGEDLLWDLDLRGVGAWPREGAPAA